jgi:putative aldouronate transport system substrate-binding protein
MSTDRSPSLTRRRFLAAGGGLSLAAMVGASACGTSSEKGSSGPLEVLLPGTVPDGWSPVLAAVNKKMKDELGFTLAPQFIAWTNYGNQALLKFTAGEKFDTALQARWLNMTQLVASKSIAPVDALLSGGKYPHLTGMLDPKLIQANKWSGTLYGIPQVNSAARLQHFTIRQDLADKYGIGQITDYATLEKFWYDVKQKDSAIVPMGVNSNMAILTAVPGPLALFNAYSWENPYTISQSFTGSSVAFIMAADAKQTGSSRPVPFWEAAGVMDALRTIRRYYQDGIISRDALNVDADTQKGLFAAGKQATTWAITDGLSSSTYLPKLQKAVSGAQIANVIPLRGGKTSKPNQTFQSDNFVVLNTKGPSNERAMQLEDWLSIKENHDLISYGIEGKDWKPVGNDKFEQLSTYVFPGFALCWRSKLELRTKDITESEAGWFDWAQNYDNFTVDPFASFVPDVEPVKRENAQISAAYTQYAYPLFFGAVDVDKGLNDLKKALSSAGLDKVQAEMEKQANAYLKTQ